MAELSKFGRIVVDNGYPVTALRPDSKVPCILQWNVDPYCDGEVLARALRQGVPQDKNGRTYTLSLTDKSLGIVTGTGGTPVVAIDIDVLDPAAAAQVQQWCTSNIGPTLCRIGQAPKSLLVYRVDPADLPLKKRASSKYEDLAGEAHRVEVLATGQQFAAFATHSGTKRPYDWGEGQSPLDVPVSALPLITTSHLDSLLAYTPVVAQAYGWEEVTRPSTPAPDPQQEDSFFEVKTPAGVSDEEIKSALQEMDCDDRDEWLTVGMTLHHERGGAESGFELWDAWAQQSPKYAGEEYLRYRWNRFHAERGADNTATFRTVLGLANSRRKEREVAERDALRTALHAAIAKGNDPSSLFSDIGKEYGMAFAGNAVLRAEAVGLLQARFKDITGTSIPVADVRRELRAYGADPPAPAFRAARRERTEFGNAGRLLDRYGQGVIYVPELAVWYTWDDISWRPSTGVEIEHMAKATISALTEEIEKIESDEEREAHFKFCAASQKASMVANMVKLASSDPRVCTPISALNADKMLLGVANGLVDLRTGEFHQPDPDALITITTRAEYHDDAECPLFEQTLLDVFFDDAEMAAFFQRLIGYSLMGDPKEDVLVIPHGDGSNGKSTVFGVIRETLGGYAKTAQAETFLTSGNAAGGGGPREDILRLQDARFVYIAEPDEGAELREGLIKAMTGGDALPVRGMYARTTVEVEPTWCPIMPTNHKPIVKGDDHGIWRRLMLVPFTRNFDKDEGVTKDLGRAARLRDEIPGILRWCVQGALAYQKEGLSPPQKVRDAVNAYRDDMDLLRDWLEECCDLDPEAFEANNILWASWERYSSERGNERYIRSSIALSRRLSSRFDSGKRSGRRGFVGIRVRHGDAPEFEDLS